MSKIPTDVLDKAIEAVLSPEKERHFLESIELQILLKEYDPKRDKRFAGSIRLPHECSTTKKVCLLADAAHVDQAKKHNVSYMDVEALRSLNKDTKLVKKLARSYDIFVVSPTLITQIPRLLGPGLNKEGKFPTVVNHQESLVDKIVEVRSTVKFQLKKTITLGVIIGNIKMTKQQLKDNLILAINFLVSLLKKNWNNIKTLTLKSTMGKPQRIYG